MIFGLMLKGLRRGKARFACASAGVAVATGALVFMASLVATNNAQAPRLAEAASAPWAAWSVDDDVMARPDVRLRTMRLTLDYRPGGRVLQGPPMRVLLAEAPATNIYANVSLSEGRWADESAREREVVCVRSAMRRFARLPEPPLGSDVKFVGRGGTMTARIVGYLDGGRLPREFPTVLANGAAFSALASERTGAVSFFSRRPVGDVDGLLTARAESVVQAFKSDEQKRMDYVTPLLLAAAFLTALALLANALVLSVEANRTTLATLRMAGLTRSGVVAFVAAEALCAGLVGWGVGALGALGALAAYVARFEADFPVGPAVDFGRLALTLGLLPVVVFLSVLFALAPALRVRALDAASRRPRPRRLGMAMTFACGFAAFVAVEVWGASLMRAFVPSPEWPDAIVSILPGGVSSFEVDKLRTVDGVRRVSELVPRQLPFAVDGRRNALFLGAEFLPAFRFLEGSWDEADKALRAGDAVVITEMMSTAHGLHKGDVLRVWRAGRRGEKPEPLCFPVAGVVDLNWHMVTSRGLVRGLGGMPGMTDGPVFCSLDTMGLVDPRTYVVEPAFSAPMTHLWVEYEPSFLRRHGVFAAGRLVEAEIVRRLGNPEGSTVRLHARDEIADGTLAHGNDLVGQVARVPFIFLSILSIGFVSLLVAEADARRHELAVLRAVGATQAQLAGRLALVAVRTALAGMAAGLPVGALAGWLCSIRTGGIWPGLPHYFVLPWRIVAEGAFGALAFALVFAVPTSLFLMRAASSRRR